MRQGIEARPLRETGFSLIEIVMVIVVLGILGAAGSMLIRDGLQAYLGGRNITRADSQARLAIERITRELRDARSATAADLITAPNTQIAFTTTSGTSVSYARSGTTLIRNSDTNQPLVDNVTSLGFTYLQNDGQTATTTATGVYYITVQFTVNDGTSVNATYRGTVKPRTF